MQNVFTSNDACGNNGSYRPNVATTCPLHSPQHYTTRPAEHQSIYIDMASDSKPIPIMLALLDNNDTLLVYRIHKRNATRTAAWKLARDIRNIEILELEAQ